MAQRSNRFYNRYFTRCLIDQVRLRRLRFPDLPDIDFPARCTLRRYDELYTARINGFADDGSGWRDG